MDNWLFESVMYQIYPLGLCGAPRTNEAAAAVPVSRIKNLTGWVPHLKKLGVNAVMFNPVFQSDTHGYNTRDFYTIDSRLGTDDDFADVCTCLHENGIRVMLDAVFNHVGRGFWAFKDVQRNRQNSLYCNWFAHIDWNVDSPYNDGFSYEGWEGHYDLVKLNLANPDVVEHLFGAVKKWTEAFAIDGLRLDVAYCLPHAFLKQLKNFTSRLQPGLGGQFVLLGEIVQSSDYTDFVNSEMLASCTNYECSKGLYSSFNESNMFEIAYSLNRQFGPEGLYRTIPLLDFAENHDISRVASILKNKADLPLLYGIIFAMPGFPCIYYAGEWGCEGRKEDGDAALRPAFSTPSWNGLTDFIARLARIRTDNDSLKYGDYTQLFILNKQFVFSRHYGTEEVIVAVNCSDDDYIVTPHPAGYAAFAGMYGNFTNMFTGSIENYNGPVRLFPKSIQYWYRNS
jgi:glycosidase